MIFNWFLFWGKMTNYLQFFSFNTKYYVLNIYVFTGETTGYSIKPDKNTTELIEDTNITLSCIYEGSIDSLHWYQQTPGSRPEFLIMIDEASEYLTKANPPFPRLSTKLDKVQRRVHLEISSAAVTDSAMYYCALRPTVTGNTRTLYKNPYCM